MEATATPLPLGAEARRLSAAEFLLGAALVIAHNVYHVVPNELGAGYLLSRRNFWVPILAHGFIDTFAVVVAFLGLAS